MSITGATMNQTYWSGLAALKARDRETILLLLAKDRWASELAKDNVLLFFLLVRTASRYGLSYRKMQLMTHMKRPALLSLLQYQGTPAMERFLRRCGFLRIDEREFNVLHKFASRPIPQWAMHWSLPHLSLFTSVDEATLPFAVQSCNAVLRDFAGKGNSAVLDYRAGSLNGALPDDVRDLFNTYAEIDRLIALVDDEAEQHRERLALARCNTRGRVDWLHEDLADRGQYHWSAHVRQRMVGRVWPNPPLPGNVDVVPVDSPEMLIEEGYRMHHCIPTYVERILDGTGFAYRVLSPERGTVFVELTEAGQWQVLDVRLVCNAVPSSATKVSVDQWLGWALEETGV